METICDKIRDIVNDSEFIRNSTGYGQVLYHGNRADSGEGNEKRMSYIKDAEKMFLDQNQKKIIEIAADLCFKSLGDFDEIKHILKIIDKNVTEM